MSSNAQHFAQRVLDAFAAAGNRTDAAVGAAGGPSTSTMTKFRKVASGLETMPEPREPTWSKIDKAAGWQRGSAQALWHGLEPQLIDRHIGRDITDMTHVFGDLPPAARSMLVDLAYAMLGRNNQPSVVVRREDGQRIGVARTNAYSTFTEDIEDVALDLATDVLFDETNGDVLVVQLLKGTSGGTSTLLFERVPPPIERVRPLLNAARDIGGPSRGQQKRADADRAGEPLADDPDDMEPR